MFRRALMVAALLVIPSVAMPARNHGGLGRPASEADILRAWAFARCMLFVYKGVDQFAADDASAAAAFYLDVGEGGLPFDKLTPLAEKAAGRRTPEQLARMHHDGAPATVDHFKMVDCLEFYESVNLRAVVKTIR